jgi:hypothetical protein
MKGLKYILVAIGLALIALPDAQALAVKTDPFDNAGTSYFRDIVPSGSQDIVPNIVYPFLPSGSILKNALASDVRNAPDVGAVEATIVFLAQAFAGKGSDTGVWLWRIAMVFITAGLLLSGFLTFQAISQGKKGIGEGIVSFLTKIILSIVLFTFVVPNVPPALIGISNVITRQIDSWYIGGTPGSGGTGSLQALEAVFKMKMGAAQAAAQATAVTVAATADRTLRDDRAARVKRRIASDSTVRNALDADFSSEWREVTNKFNRVTARGRRGASGESIKEVNELISKLANQQVTTVMDQITKIIDQEVGSAPSGGGATPSPTSTGDEELKNQMARAPQSIDYSKFTYPTRLIQSYAYLAFVYLSLSIWGMGFGAIVWTMLYSMPEEWNMGNLLVSGFKAGIAVVLGIVLVAIYITAGIHHSNVEATKAAGNGWRDWLSFTGAIPGWGGVGLIADVAGGIARAWRDPGSAVVNFMSRWTEMLPEQFIIGMLIMTAPAQAALLVKGGNGVAESAKNALHNQSASSGSIGSMAGMWGGSAGVNSTGGQGFSAQGIMRNRSDDIRAGFGPGRRQ